MASNLMFLKGLVLVLALGYVDVFGQLDGGYQALTAGDAENVKVVKKMIRETLYDRYKVDCYNVQLCLTNVQGQSQVVSGTNYHFTLDLKATYKCHTDYCKDCVERNAECSKWEATVFFNLSKTVAPIYTSKPNMTSVFNC